MGLKIVGGLLILLGFCILLAEQGEASPVHIHLDDTRLPAHTTRENNPQTRSTYIIHVHKSFAHGSMNTLETPHSRYTQLLQSIKPLDSNGESANSPLHVYSTVCHGFSASLTSEEAEALRKMDEVLGVHPDTIRSLHTTRTPGFLQLNSLKGLLPAGHFGDDVIVGLLDTGVWPERESFSDEGLGPVPERWKGICQEGENFNASNCNRKLIGARYYVAGYEAFLNRTGGSFNATLLSKSPRDTEGHGSHTSSTAAGSPVPNASLFGLANGIARGMAPRARIAMYKVCWGVRECIASDIAAGIDQAVADGVDIISLSLGGSLEPYNKDLIAVVAFGAMEKGVFVSAAAGNSGPEFGTVVNQAPWMMTVGASTLDRTFPANVVLGNGQIVSGESLYVGKGLKNATQMITGADASLGNITESTSCIPGSLNHTLVAGKIVVCEIGPNVLDAGAEVLALGGAGIVVTNIGGDEGTITEALLLPALWVGSRDGTAILDYMKSTKNPIGNFQFLGTRLNVRPAPVVTSFSSRGPNVLTPQVPKPDITAPGENIIAAWTGAVGPTGLDHDTRRVEFNIISGTSMSTPHISGIAALLKGAHPHWSPASIKSAMMTTATIRDNTGGFITDAHGNVKATPLQYGSGEVQPQQALDPGLVYDMEFQDYVNFLCASNYSEKDIQIFTSTHNETVRCPKSPIRLEDLNYPSFAAVFQQPPSLEPISLNMTRTVTHVGHPNATYKAQIVEPAGIEIIVDPLVLSFSGKDRKKTFTVQVTTVNLPNTTLSNGTVTDFGYLLWIDDTHVVQSPITVTVYK